MTMRLSRVRMLATLLSREGEDLYYSGRAFGGCFTWMRDHGLIHDSSSTTCELTPRGLEALATAVAEYERHGRPDLERHPAHRDGSRRWSSPHGWTTKKVRQLLEMAAPK